MSTTCHICSAPLRDGWDLRQHFEFVHTAHAHRVNVAVTVAERPLPLREIDIDQIHSSRFAAAKPHETVA